MSRVITFTTDFGTRDGFVAQMKGVILRRAPGAVLMDVTHDIEPFSLREAALVLRGVVRYFPPGTIHVAVVDPGVGGARRGLVVRVYGQFCVGPDNGLFSPALDSAPEWEAREILNPDLTVKEPHHTFHGRDVFAPVAAALAAGTRFEDVGPRVTDPVLLSIPRPTSTAEGLYGEVIYIDRFGNLCSNLDASLLNRQRIRVIVGDAIIPRLSKFFSEVAEGQPVAVINSFGLLEIAVNRGNAAESLSVQRGDPVRVIWG